MNLQHTQHTNTRDTRNTRNTNTRNTTQHKRAGMSPSHFPLSPHSSLSTYNHTQLTPHKHSHHTNTHTTQTLATRNTPHTRNTQHVTRLTLKCFAQTCVVNNTACCTCLVYSTSYFPLYFPLYKHLNSTFLPS
jgi:hypothetical protein